MFFGGCSFIEQNDFVLSETISNEANERIYYNVYQTGIDNYRFEFIATNNSDTTKLFEYYLNDAVYKAMKFSNSKTRDTLKIKTNFPTNNTIATTAIGTVVILTNE
jgi:hypothetical protein